MEPKLFISGFLKTVTASFITLILISITGVIFQYLSITRSGVEITAFEYGNGKFFLNGHETYNQFSPKYRYFNLLIFGIYASYYFRDSLKIIKQ